MLIVEHKLKYLRLVYVLVLLPLAGRMRLFAVSALALVPLVGAFMPPGTFGGISSSSVSRVRDAYL